MHFEGLNDGRTLRKTTTTKLHRQQLFHPIRLRKSSSSEQEHYLTHTSPFSCTGSEPDKSAEDCVLMASEKHGSMHAIITHTQLLGLSSALYTRPSHLQSLAGARPFADYAPHFSHGKQRTFHSENHRNFRR